MKRRISSLFRCVSTVLCVVVVLGLGGAAYMRWQHQIDFLPVLTGSMEPNVATGALAVARPVPKEQIAVGDVVVFQRPAPYAGDDTRPMVHRISDITEYDGVPVVSTRGDANNIPDPWQLNLRETDFWKVHTTIPHAGAVALYIKHQPHVAGGVVGGLLLISYAAGYLWRNRRAQHRRTAPDAPSANGTTPNLSTIATTRTQTG